MLALLFWTSSSRADLLTVDATANIFGAGHSSAPDPDGGGGGILPPEDDVPAGAGLVLTMTSITGSASLSPGASSDGSGYSTYGPTDISSYGGISGIVDTGAGGFLVGVFLGPDEPVDPAPSSLTFDYPADFTTLSPLLNQTFLIGDGLNDVTEAVQQFFVPSGATRLFLGFADAYGYQGAPGQYQDNSGALDVSFQFATPEPTSLALLGCGAIGFIALAVRRRMLLETA